MSWAGLSNNQIVSDSNLADACLNGLFSAKTSIPSTGKQLTRSAVEGYVYVESITSKTTNQLVAKRDLIASTPPPSISFNVTSGLYPISGMASSTVVGNIVNNTSGYLYMSWKFNSAGVLRGTLNAGQDTYETDTEYGQLIGTWTGYGSEIIQSMFVVAPNSTKSITMTKNDGYGSGSYIRIGYATSPNGSITWL